MRPLRVNVRTITPVADIPLLFSADVARQELRADLTGDTNFDGDEDALIEAKILAATGFVESFTGQVLTPRELELVLNRFPCLPELISIPRAPVTAINSIAYTDASTGTEVALGDTDFRWSDSLPDTILPAFRLPWPIAAFEPGSVRVRFSAGYEEGLAPPPLVAAVKAMVVHLYESRTAVVAGERAAAVELPLGVRDLCAGYRRVLI